MVVLERAPIPAPVAFDVLLALPIHLLDFMCGVRGIHATVGEDAAILHPDEALDEAGMKAIYTGEITEGKGAKSGSGVLIVAYRPTAGFR